VHELLTPEQLRDRIGKEVLLFGWVHDVRVLGGISFVLLRNSKGIVQLALPKKDVTPELFEFVPRLHQEDVISCKGRVKESKAARHGFEVVPSSIELVSKSDSPLPLDPRGVTPASLDTRLEWRTLQLRTPEATAVFRVESALVEGMERYLHENGFIRTFTPSILGGISEGGAEVFKIDYYGKPAFLRQDPQLHRQLVIAGGFDRIYDLGTNWRAELSHTPRHLSEHRTIAPEMAFIEDEHDVMKAEEGMVKASIRFAVVECRDELSLLKVELHEPSDSFPEVTFVQAYEVLDRLGMKYRKGEDLSDEALRALAKDVDQRTGSEYFFLNRFPSAVKPFYVMRVDEEPEYARSVDFVFRGMELSSGGQREHRREKIIEQITEKGMDPKSLEWFTEPFRYGVPPHGGYSFGIERFTAQLLRMDSVKEAVLFPRDPDRLSP